jgi:hypothetical protein
VTELSGQVAKKLGDGLDRLIIGLESLSDSWGRCCWVKSAFLFLC